MNNLNDKSKNTAASLDTKVIRTSSNVIEIKAPFTGFSAAGKLSARPTRSLFKSKSIKKPFMANKVNNSETKNS